jgi:hypothetical protein
LLITPHGGIYIGTLQHDDPSSARQAGFTGAVPMRSALVSDAEAFPMIGALTPEP